VVAAARDGRVLVLFAAGTLGGILGAVVSTASLVS
jgi:hypothetical protein